MPKKFHPRFSVRFPQVAKLKERTRNMLLHVLTNPQQSLIALSKYI